MKPPSKIPLTSRNQIVGIGVCASAACPILFLMGIVSDMLSGVSLSTLATAFWSLPFAAFMLAWAVIAIFLFPTFVMIGIGMHVLAVRRHDTFMICTACGAVIGCAALSIALKIAMSFTQYVDFADPFNAWDAAFLAIFSSIMSGLYWYVAVRRDRHHRQVIEEHQRAIRAME
jgi:hypothetical protein